MDYKKFAESKFNKNNLFPNGTDSQEAMDVLADYLMEYHDWPYLVEYPASTLQMNTEVTLHILYLLRKKTFSEKLRDLF